MTPLGHLKLTKTHKLVESKNSVFVFIFVFALVFVFIFVLVFVFLFFVFFFFFFFLVFIFKFYYGTLHIINGYWISKLLTQIDLCENVADNATQTVKRKF